MKPLEDVRIIAVEQYGAGPFGSVHLADLGAEVIKIEDPRVGGDVGRYVPPYGEERGLALLRDVQPQQAQPLARPHHPRRAAGLRGAGQGQRRRLLQPARRRAGEDRHHLRRPQAPQPEDRLLFADRLRDDRAALARSPATTTCCRGWPAGWTLTGEPDGPPTKSGLSLVDYSGGFVAAISLLAGLHAARRDGVGMDCDVSLYDTAMAMLTYPATWHLNAGFDAGAHPPLRAPVAGAVPGLRGRRRLAGRRLRQGEVLGPARRGRRPPGVGAAGLAVRDVRRPAAQQRASCCRSWRRSSRSGPSTSGWRCSTPAAIPCGPINDVAAALARGAHPGPRT